VVYSPRLPGYLTFAEAARTKRTTRQTLYDAIRRQQLDVVRIGARRLIVTNARFRQWRPDPASQRGGRLGARRRYAARTD
jgi:hypothetical protein